MHPMHPSAFAVGCLLFAESRERRRPDDEFFEAWDRIADVVHRAHDVNPERPTLWSALEDHIAMLVENGERAASDEDRRFSQLVNVMRKADPSALSAVTTPFARQAFYLGAAFAAYALTTGNAAIRGSYPLPDNELEFFVSVMGKLEATIDALVFTKQLARETVDALSDGREIPKERLARISHYLNHPVITGDPEELQRQVEKWWTRVDSREPSGDTPG